MGETVMLINPVERYCVNKGKEECKLDVARNLLSDGFPVDKVVELTGLSKEDILNVK